MLSPKASAVIPSSEQEVLALTIEDAIDLGLNGSIRDGHRALQVGLELAREEEANGEPWGSALAALWQAAVDEYCARFGAKLTGLPVEGPADQSRRYQAA